LHGRSLRKRYELIARAIGEKKRVFEPGCGTCLIYSYLHDGCEYEGWDLNERFINYNIKSRRRVFQKNMFDFNDYPPNDVIILSDLLHHVVPRHEDLIKMSLQKTTRLIVSETPTSFKLQRKFKRIAHFLHSTILDDDGINPFDNMVEWDYPREKLTSLFAKYGCTNIITAGRNLIAVFDK
jgi:SAM-dependent methyltransferase